MGYADRRFEEGFALGELQGKEGGIAIGELRGELRARRQLVAQLYRQRFKSFTPAHEAVILNASPDVLEIMVNSLFIVEHPDELLSATAV
ncbi:MAG: hypothetical protein IPN01_30595 [Deltaproteobacteria bacterium]|nr:hypothetical protein [Deltaproteobacteria bacterium]